MKRALVIPKWRVSSISSYSTRCFSSDPYCLLLHALREEPGSISLLKQVHALVITNGLLFKSVLACRLVGYYGRISGPVDARKLFDCLPNRASHAYSYMLRVYVDVGHYQSALKLYSRLLATAEAFPNVAAFSFVLKACIGLRSVRVGKIVHAHVLATRSVSDLHLNTDFIRFYSKCELVDDAKKLFDMMPHRDVVVWTTTIDGYFRNGHYSEALCLFREMRESSGLKANATTWNAVITGFARDELMSDALYQFSLMQMDGVRPDEVSLSTILPLFSRAAILKPGLEAHAYAIRNGFALDLFVASALVDMYAKCGNIGSARCLFDHVQLKDTGLWNAIIVGYGMHGDCMEVLQLFEQMKTSGMRPNKITFTAVLSACSHVGLLSEGRRVFYQIVHKYGIMPSPEHYACMVDMFGRAGQLEEALEFIKKMPLNPTKDVWGALLSACRTHPNNVEIAEIAVQNMLETKKSGEEAGYHVMMSNIYAETGQWGDVAKVRIQMRDLGLKKRTGFSWIEIGETVYTFNSVDISHPHSEKIYALLDDLEVAISLDVT